MFSLPMTSIRVDFSNFSTHFKLAIHFFNFHFVGGHVVVQCVSAADQHSLQLILDYLTDTVTSTVSLTGRPMTSPDSRHLITVDQFSGRVTVASISEEGRLII